MNDRNLAAPTLDPSLIFGAKVGFDVLKETLHGIMMAKTDETRTNLCDQALWAAEVIGKDIAAAYANICAVAEIDAA